MQRQLEAGFLRMCRYIYIYVYIHNVLLYHIIYCITLCYVVLYYIIYDTGVMGVIGIREYWKLPVRV